MAFHRSYSPALVLKFCPDCLENYVSTLMSNILLRLRIIRKQIYNEGSLTRFSSDDRVITYQLIETTMMSMSIHWVMHTIRMSIGPPSPLSLVLSSEDNHHRYRQWCPAQIFPFTHIATYRPTHYDSIYWLVWRLWKKRGRSMSTAESRYEKDFDENGRTLPTFKVY